MDKAVLEFAVFEFPRLHLALEIALIQAPSPYIAALRELQLVALEHLQHNILKEQTCNNSATS